jgi:hypothetical protein
LSLDTTVGMMTRRQPGALLQRVVIIAQPHLTARPCWSWLSWMHMRKYVPMGDPLCGPRIAHEGPRVWRDKAVGIMALDPHGALRKRVVMGSQHHTTRHPC